jgi:hypothetical protein
MLDIQEFLLELVFPSCAEELPSFSELPRPSSAGRLTGVFCDGDVEKGGGVGRDGSGMAGAMVCGGLRSSGARAGGRPPWADVLGGTSCESPGEEGACWR